MHPIHSSRSWFTRPARLLVALLVCAGARAQPQPAAEAETSLPSTLIGRWQVTKVLVDPKLFKPNYDQDDPRMKGRLLTIAPGRITEDLSGWVSTCTYPVVSRQRITAGELVRSAMSDVRPGPPTAEDYQLPLASSAEVDVLWIRCKSAGDVGPSGPPGRAGFNWLLVLPDDRLAIRWYDYNTIAVLSRLPAGAVPSPSFDCAQATTKAERAICGSIDLASFDRSVAEAYADAVKEWKKTGGAEGLRKLQKEQRESLRARNRCGANEECLRKVMSKRLERILAESYP